MLDVDQINREAAVRPLLAPVADCKRWIGISPITLRRLMETEAGFPQAIRVAHRITLFDVEKTAAYLSRDAGAAPRATVRGRPVVNPQEPGQRGRPRKQVAA